MIQISCDSRAHVPIIENGSVVDISAQDSAQLHFVSSSAFGTMVSTEDGGPFWRQRLMHLAARHLLQARDGLDSGSILSAHSLTPTEIGRLLIASFVITSSEVTSLGEKSLNALADRVMLDFSRIYADGSETTEIRKNLGTLMFSVKEMVLAAVVKLMAVAPTTVSLVWICCSMVSIALNLCPSDLRSRDTTRRWCQVYYTHILIRARRVQ